MSPDGNNVYVTGFGSDSVVWFTRLDDGTVENAVEYRYFVLAEDVDGVKERIRQLLRRRHELLLRRLA